MSRRASPDELRSIMRRAALAGSNMENFELHIAASRDSGAGTQSPAADLGNFDFPKARSGEAPHEQADPRRATEADRGVRVALPDGAAGWRAEQSGARSGPKRNRLPARRKRSRA
jgi:hypothetical protein